VALGGPSPCVVWLIVGQWQPSPRLPGRQGQDTARGGAGAVRAVIKGALGLAEPPRPTAAGRS
jgi:hypothetical protein